MILPTSVHRLSLLLFLLAVPLSPVLGQSSVSGVVVDANTDEPLSSANVFVDGGKQGTATDDRGRFRLTGLASGRHTVVASMVGYKPKRIPVVVGDSSQAADGPSSLRFELRPDPVKMRGVTVEESREKWLERLEEFREAFFGTVPTAEKCSFVNPEVIVFEEKEDALVAHAEKPLRVRNDALGYELTYHLSHFAFNPGGLLGRRLRLGPVSFDTLTAQSPQQRQAWREARRETYRGSFNHFIDALRADALREEGFIVSIAEEISVSRSASLSGRTFYETQDRENRGTDAAEIFTSTRTPGQGILSVPEAEHLIKVTYTRKEEHQSYAQKYRKRTRTRNRQTSWIQLVGDSRVPIDLQTGDFLRVEAGYYVLKGYWGWYGTAAVELPGDYRPPGAP